MAIGKASLVQEIVDVSQVGEARRSAMAVASAAGFNETDTGKVAIGVTEAATNIIRHGKGGKILLRSLENGVEMLAIDKGPGIANVAEALRDSRSTGGTLGIGLGAVARLAAVFEIYTGQGIGTAIFAEFRRSEPAAEFNRGFQPVLETGVAQSCYPGEHYCGDAWGLRDSCLCVVDGLGHGIEAAKAARRAIEVFDDTGDLAPRDRVEAIHLALRSTRGAAVAIACIDVGQGLALFCGLGNIAGAIVDKGRSRGLMSQNGTAGHEVGRIVQVDYSWSQGALLVLHSDGISAKWDLELYPGLSERHPALIAAVLFRDYRRGKDDATIMVARSRAPLRGRT
jgi:anti-sigma regulatory factor (Ser/Thr protein kinase)